MTVRKQEIVRGSIRKLSGVPKSYTWDVRDNPIANCVEISVVCSGIAPLRIPWIDISEPLRENLRQRISTYLIESSAA
jgi:hypothetical protein